MQNESKAAKTTSILAVGDSMTSYMGQILESFCVDTKVYNAGIGGTTAEQWASYTQDDIVGCGSNWDVVYISVGGNDLLESGCTLNSIELKSRMENAVTNIVKNLAPGASRYIMTGYCMPSAAEESGDSGCSNPSDYAALSDAIRELSAESVGVPSTATLEVIDSFAVCGGSVSSFSNEAYFQDSVHLNAKGYCKVFSQPSVQTALTCNSANGHDCDSLDGAEIYGLEDNCLSGGGGSGSGDSTTSSGALLKFSKMFFDMLNVILVLMMNR
jgi:lysophospholipase L1-like esterase